MGPASGTVLTKALETAKAPTLFTSASEQVLKERREPATSERREVEVLKRVTTASALESAKTATVKGVGLLPLLTILVVFRTLRRITDHIVGLLQRLELGLRLRIVRMQIGMELLGSFQISLFHILLGYRFVNP